MIDVDDAQARILGSIERLSAEQVFISDGLGRVLAEDVLCERDLPAWSNSAMDGFAVRAADVTEEPRPLPVDFTVAAGARCIPTLKPGRAARIFTGAPLPAGADTVMIQENATVEGQTVSFNRAAVLSENVRPVGNDARAGTVVLHAGRHLAAGDIGLLAALGRSYIQVYRRPRVTVVSTGSELAPIDSSDLGVGQIINSNVHALAALIQSSGGIPLVLPPVKDCPDAIRRAFQDGASADVLVTSGGMSVGDFDHVRGILRELTGDAFSFWKVAVKPGKPLGFGRIGSCAVFGLPGNPVSACVTFELFVRPALRSLQGHTGVLPRVQRARLLEPIKGGGARRLYLRARASFDGEGQLWADASRNQSSGALTSIANADGLVIVPPHADAKASGDIVDVIMLNQDIAFYTSDAGP